MAKIEKKSERLSMRLKEFTKGKKKKRERKDGKCIQRKQ